MLLAGGEYRRVPSSNTVGVAPISSPTIRPLPMTPPCALRVSSLSAPVFPTVRQKVRPTVGSKKSGGSRCVRGRMGLNTRYTREQGTGVVPPAPSLLRDGGQEGSRTSYLFSTPTSLLRPDCPWGPVVPVSDRGSRRDCLVRSRTFVLGQTGPQFRVETMNDRRT